MYQNSLYNSGLTFKAITSYLRVTEMLRGSSKRDFQLATKPFLNVIEPKNIKKYTEIIKDEMPYLPFTSF